MGLIKFVTCVLLFVAVSSAFDDAGFVKIPRKDDHNINRCETEGQATWTILDSETVSQKGKLWQIVEGTSTYPTIGNGKYLITCIRVTDLDGNGKGGYPTILEGGLGFHYVSIHFVSQRSHGYNFAVEIWGIEE